MEDTKRIVEINGIKLEVDLRNARRIEEFRVGDAVKILAKGYGEDYKSHFGVIVGFDDFKTLPTIIVAYLLVESWSNESPLRFAYVNSKSKDIEVIGRDENDLMFEKSAILGEFEKLITKKKQELVEIEHKKQYFLDMFGRYFEPVRDVG